MTKLIALVAALAAALSLASTASADPGWRDFGNADLDCAIGRISNKHGAVCVVTNGALEGWSFSMGDYGIRLSNASSRLVFKKIDYRSDGFVFHPTSPWPYMASGVMCNKNPSAVSCMIRKDVLAGWGVLLWGDGVEITNADGRTVFHRGEAL